MAPPEQRHQPKQSRSQETYKSILHAAADLFESRGYEQTTTHQIASKAGVSVGALYRYFADKKAIIKELYQQEITDLRSLVLNEFSISDLVGQDMGKLVRKTIALAFKVYSQRPGLRRVLGEQSRRIPELQEIRRAQEAEIHQAVRQILAAVPIVKLPDPEVGAYMVMLFLDSLLEDYILYSREENSFERDRIIDAATDFILRYALGTID